MNHPKYMDLFLSESREHLAAVEGELAKLAERPSDTETLAELFRHAHSLKGMAASMGFDEVSSFAHRVEDALYRIQTGAFVFDPQARAALSHAFDLLEKMISAIGSGADFSSETARRVAALGALQGAGAGREAHGDGDALRTGGVSGPAERPGQMAQPTIPRGAGAGVLRIDIDVAAEAQLPAARAALAVKRLERFGTIAHCEPGFEDLARRAFHGRVSVLLATERDAGEIRAALLAIAEIASVTIAGGDTPGGGTPSAGEEPEHGAWSPASAWSLGAAQAPHVAPSADLTADASRSEPTSDPSADASHLAPSADLTADASQPEPTSNASAGTSHLAPSAGLSVAPLTRPIGLASEAPHRDWPSEPTDATDATSLQEREVPIAAAFSPPDSRGMAWESPVGAPPHTAVDNAPAAGPSGTASSAVPSDSGEPPTASSPPDLHASSPTVRIPARSLDQFLDAIGELIVQRGRLAGLVAATADRATQISIDQMKSLTDRLYRDVMTLRLLPFATIAHRFERSVRELSERLGKRAVIEISGREVLIDRSMLDELFDPINHLLRNALDHGIEPPAERRALGKPEAGIITIALQRTGDGVTIRVSDDGRGLSAERVKQAALDKGFITRARFDAMAEAEAFLLTTIPGFSTSDSLTEVSGRGVGMDIVRTRVETLGGRLALSSQPGAGLTVEMRLPLTIVVVQAFLVRSGGRTWAVPLASVSRTLQLDPAWILREGGAEFLAGPGDPVPLFDLARILGLEDSSEAHASLRHLLVADDGGSCAAFVVDRIVGRREIVVKPLRKPLEGMRGYTGAAILDDGSIALILDLLGLAGRRG